MVNFVVAEEMVLPYLPAGTELDHYNGQCYVSLVGFLFQDTRLRGVRLPFHAQFEEVNLRFYVRRAEKRGVVFISEIVPRLALQIVANTFYGERYSTARMRHEWKADGNQLCVGYKWFKNDKWHEIKINTSLSMKSIEAGSEEEFITEHYWGYTKLPNGCTSEYEVVHPRWQVYPVASFSFDVDFARLYGPEFAMLNEMSPASVLLAEGSEVAVLPGQRIISL